MPTADAYIVAEALKHAIEDSMSNVSNMREALEILNKHIDHPELDRVITELARFYRNNAKAHALCGELSKAVRGRKIQVKK